MEPQFELDLPWPVKRRLLLKAIVAATVVACLICAILKSLVLDSLATLLANLGSPISISVPLASVLAVIFLTGLLSAQFYFTLKQIVEKQLSRLS